MWNLAEETLFGCYVTTLNNAFEIEMVPEDKGFEIGSESFNIPTPHSRALRIYHVSTMEDLSFTPANFSQSLTTPECHHLCLYSTPTLNTEQLSMFFDGVAWDDDITSSEGNFPTAPLDDEVWPEDPILDRQLCICKAPQEQNCQCSYPCPYSTTTFKMDLPQSTPQDAAVLNYELMDFNDISSDLPDIMTTTSDDDIPDLMDILNSEHLDNIQHKARFA